MPQIESFDRIEQVIVRRPSKNIAAGSLPGAVGVPDYERACLQHAALCEALKACGSAISSLPPDTGFPAASMIADVAVLTGRLAVLSNFPAIPNDFASEDNPRQGEQQAAASVLAASRFLKFITAPGTLDAADVLRLGDRFYIGLSPRTNAEGAAQLAYHLKDFGHESTIIDLEGAAIPRLSAAACYLGRDRILIREEIARHYAFLEYEKIVLGRQEKSAASSIRVNGTLIVPQGCPGLKAELKFLDLPWIEVNVSEFEKTGAGLSCLSLRVPAAEKANVTLFSDWKKQGAA